MSQIPIAIVTGAGRVGGMGAGIASELSKAGFGLVLTDVAPPAETGLESAKDTIGPAAVATRLSPDNSSAFGIAGDLRDDAFRATLVDRAMATFGRVDVLVNNAGAPRRLYQHHTGDLQESDIHEVFLLNAGVPALLTQSVLPHMLQAGHGRVVNVSSVAAKTGGVGVGMYAASKAALIAWSRSIALEYASHGITVNCVCPGRIATSNALAQMLEDFGEENLDTAIREREATIPVGRMGTPEEVGSLVAYLASRSASFVTGRAILIDGGQIA